MAIGSWSDDFRDKYGFHDGATCEDRDFRARAVIVREVNATKEFKEAEVKAIEFDRPGAHNPCMILLAPAKADPEAWLASSDPEPAEPEIDYEEIVAMAYAEADGRRRRRK